LQQFQPPPSAVNVGVQPPLPSAPIADWQSSGTGFDPRVQRLPPIEAYVPRTGPARLPQQPIPSYPNTGK
jgi:hypothetical protein